jgi:hypothetical protein
MKVWVDKHCKKTKTKAMENDSLNVLKANSMTSDFTISPEKYEVCFFKYCLTVEHAFLLLESRDRSDPSAERNSN